MPASEIALPLRVGTRTLVTLRRPLVHLGLSLAEALGERVPALTALDPRAEGYRILSLPASQLAPLLARHPRLKPFIRQRYARRYARLDQDFESYLGGFSAKSRSTVKRKLKRFAERAGGAVDLRCFASEPEIERFYAAARAVSVKTYQERSLDAGLPSGEEALAVMRASARAGDARGWLLYLDNAPIAYLWAPATDGTLLYAYLGYDPAFADLSPGTVLQMEAMRQLMAEKQFRLFDFTEGDGQHKRLFATDAVDCVDLLLVRRSVGALTTAYVVSVFDGAVALAKRARGRLSGR